MSKRGIAVIIFLAFSGILFGQLNKNIEIAVGGLGSLPLADFGDKANLGFGFFTDARINMVENVAWYTTAAININTSKDEVNNEVKLDDYRNIWVLTGLGTEFMRTDTKRLFISGQIGLLIATLQDYNIYDEKIESQKVNSLALGLSAGIKVDNFTVGLKYLYGEPTIEYDVETTINEDENYSVNDQKAISVINLFFGYVF